MHLHISLQLSQVRQHAERRRSCAEKNATTALIGPRLGQLSQCTHLGRSPRAVTSGGHLGRSPRAVTSGGHLGRSPRAVISPRRFISPHKRPMLDRRIHAMCACPTPRTPAGMPATTFRELGAFTNASVHRRAWYLAPQRSPVARDKIGPHEAHSTRRM